MEKSRNQEELPEARERQFGASSKDLIAYIIGGEDNIRNRYKNLLLLSLVLLTILLPTATWFGIEAPAKSRYYRKFGSHVVMALGQATFEGIREQIIILWEQMNVTFAGYNWDETYGVPFYWDQNYDNSLTAQQDYFEMILKRLDSYIIQYDKLKMTPGTSLLEDWYDKSMRNMREEMDRMGGLDWALKGVWYLKFAPTAFWSRFFSLIWVEIAVLLIIMAIITMVVEGEGEESWAYRKEREFEKKRRLRAEA